MIVAQRYIKTCLISGLIGLLSSQPAYAFCFNEAGAAYNVNPILLEAISYTESTLNPDAVNRSNSNGTADYGLMQINSHWFPKLEEMGVTEYQIKNDPCSNVYVGAWILARNFETVGEGWLAVGAYNAGFKKSMESARQRYISVVQKNLERLQKR